MFPIKTRRVAYAKKWFTKIFFDRFRLCVAAFGFWQMMMNQNPEISNDVEILEIVFFLHYEFNSMLFYASHAKSAEKYMRMLIFVSCPIRQSSPAC